MTTHGHYANQIVLFLLTWLAAVRGFHWGVSLTARRTVPAARQVRRKSSLLAEPTSRPQSTHFHLLSLKYTPPERTSLNVEDSLPFSKVAADLWRWKDAVLGDGRDFFVPRPKTLQKLGAILEQNCPMIQECVILSNCARFELLLAVDGDVEDHDLVSSINQQLLLQEEHYRKHVNAPTKMMVGSMDWPGVIGDEDTVHSIVLVDKARELRRYWVSINQLDEIMEHLAKIAIGVAARPRRPEREVIFRPFSSRDAHILLQMKRTVDAFPTASRLGLLLQLALSAGKAARDPQKVSELQELKPYGSGDSQKYSTQPPPELLERVNLAVHQKVIEPTIIECHSKIQANDQAELIAEFRSQCLALAQDQDETQWLKKAMHMPTMELRKSNATNVKDLIQNLQESLEERRKNKKTLSIS